MADPMNKFLPAKTRKLLGGLTPKRKPRVTLDELNRGGLEAFRTRKAEVEEPEDKRPGYQKVFDVLDVPGNAVRNVIGSIVGVDKSKLDRATFGRPRVTSADILGKLGMKPGAARSILGFAGDVATDPLTFLTAGAATGTKVAKWAPKLLKSGTREVARAAKTGALSGNLVKAVGVKGAARLEKAMSLARNPSTRNAVLKSGKVRKVTPNRLVNIEKAVKAPSGPLYRRVYGRAARGDADALKYLIDNSARGRTLFRVPFAAKGAGVLSKETLTKLLGKNLGEKAAKSSLFSQTRKFEALREGLTPAGKAAFVEQASKAGNVVAKRAAAGAAAGAAKNAMDKAIRDREAAKDIASKRTDKLIPGPAMEGLTGEPAREAIFASELARAKGAQRSAAKLEGPQLPLLAAKKADKAAAKEAVKAEGELNAFVTSPAAPAVTQERIREALGAPFTPGAPGFLAKAGAARRAAFGPATSPLRQKVAGIEAMRSREAAKKEAAVILAQKNIEPIAAKFAQQTGRNPQEIREMLYHLAAAGPGGKALAGLGAGDDLIRLVNEARAIGLDADPNVQSLLKTFWQETDAVRELRLEKRMPVRKYPGYTPAIVSKEGQAAFAQQKAAGNVKPGPTPGGKLSQRTEDTLSRSRMVTYQLPDSSTKTMLSSQQEAIDLAANPDAKLIGEELVSLQQKNKLATDPTNPLALKAFGQARPGQAAFKKPIFEADLAKSFGVLAARKERVKALAEVRDLANNWQVHIDNAKQAGDPAFAHLVKPDIRMLPDPDGPLGELVKQGLYDRYYPPQVADALNRLAASTKTPEAFRPILQAMDATLGWWKAWTLYSPAYAIRNVWQDGVGHLMNGGNPIRQMSLARSASVGKLRDAMLAGSPQGLDGIEWVAGGQRITAKKLYDIGMELNPVGAGRTAIQMPTNIAGQTGQAAALATANAGRKKVSTAIFRANMAMEDRMRLGAWLDFMEKGYSPRDAYMQTLRSMPDLADLTMWERNGARRLFPWYAWTRKNGSLQLFHHLPNSPAFIASVPKMKDLAEGFRGDKNVPDDLRPEWMREGMAAQISGNKEGGTAFVPLSWTPFEETLTAGSLAVQPDRAFKTVAGMVRPGVKFGAEMATGRNIFRGTEYQTGMSPLDYAKAAPKAFMGTSNTPLDTLLTLRPVREATQRIPAMSSPLEAAGRVAIGGAFQPVSMRGGLAREYSELSDRAKKIRNQIGRAQQANDLPLAQSLMTEYTRIQRRMLSLGLPGVPKATQKMLQAQGVKQGPPAFLVKR